MLHSGVSERPSCIREDGGRQSFSFPFRELLTRQTTRGGILRIDSIVALSPVLFHISADPLITQYARSN
jgi:hypothetical protein